MDDSNIYNLPDMTSLNDSLSDQSLIKPCPYLSKDQLSEIDCTKYDFNVIQLNIRGLLSKQSQLRDLIDDLRHYKIEIDAFLLCETYLNNKINNLVNVPGYQLISKSRQKKKMGGLLFS